MLKKILLACLILPIFTLAYADEKSYTSPQKISCLLKDNQPICDYDATYLGFDIDTKNVRDMLGTYHFDHAESYNIDITGLFYLEHITYVYFNEKNVRAWVDSIYEVLRTNSPAWVPTNGRSDHFTCTSPDIRNCTFTHTPWHEDSAMIGGIFNTPTKKNMSNAGYYKKTKRNIERNTHVAIDNRTDFLVTVNAGDYNTASFQLLTQTIPAHSKMKIMQNLNITDKKSLIFTVRIGPGLRNSNNTSVVTQTIHITGIDSVGHTINHQDVYVDWCASPADPDTSVFRVSYKDMCAE